MALAEGEGSAVAGGGGLAVSSKVKLTRVFQNILYFYAFIPTPAFERIKPELRAVQAFWRRNKDFDNAYLFIFIC